MLAPLMLVATCATTAAPFGDAVAVWHFADLADACAPHGTLEPTGAVEAGVALTGEERDASLARGGDGLAARFEGGYLSAGQGAGDELRLTGMAMTLCVRFRLDAGVTDTPLLSKHGGHAALAYNLFVADLGSGPALGFELGTDFSERPLRLSVPLAAIGAEAWHDAIVRFTGPRLELFVDGVLVDEEWPIGRVRDNAEPCLIGAEKHADGTKSGFRGLIDHAALWGRALSDAEVLALSGGSEVAARRDREILGPEPTSMAYWRPRGLGISVGDCMPFTHEGRFHVFYLYDRRGHGSKWGLGAHQWAHVSTTDLIHWEQHPMAIPIDEQWEGSICTGSVFEHDGHFHAYYATRKPDGTQHLGMATSPDCIQFTKQQPNPFLSAPEGYDPMDLRDPFVTTDPAGGYRMLVTTRLTDGRDGCIGLLRSDDLRNWRMAEPLLIPGRVTDCPDTFEWNGWHYLLAEFVYWMSPTADGPWVSPSPEHLDVMYVPKTAPFGEGRRIYVTWLPKGGWGGELVFRELLQLPDGRLGTHFVPELMPPTGDPVRLALGGHGSGVRLDATAGPAVAEVGGLPRDYVLTARVKPGPKATRLGLTLRRAGEAGVDVRLTPLGRSVEIGPAGPTGLGTGVTQRIEAVEGLGGEFGIEIVVLRDIVDVCVGGRRTIIARTSALEGDALQLFAEGDAVEFADVRVRPITDG